MIYELPNGDSQHALTEQIHALPAPGSRTCMWRSSDDATADRGKEKELARDVALQVAATAGWRRRILQTSLWQDVGQSPGPWRAPYAQFLSHVGAESPEPFVVEPGAAEEVSNRAD
jgi:hypothetical protein